jgi:hypothetical protein
MKSIALRYSSYVPGVNIGTTYAAISDLDQDFVRIGLRFRDMSDVYLTHSTENSGIPSDLISALTRVNFLDAETSLGKS